MTVLHALTSSRGTLWMLASAASVAINGELIRAVGSECDWRIAIISRALLGCVFALTFARVSGVKLVVNGPAAMWVRSLSGTAGMICNYYAYAHLPTGTALLLTASYPIWLTVFSGLAARRAPASSTWIAVILGATGIFVIRQASLGGDAMGIAAALASAVFAAISMLSISRSGGIDPQAIVAHYSATTAIVATVWLAAAGSGLDCSGLAQPRTIAGLIAITFFGTLGQFLLTRAYSIGPPRLMAVLSNTRVGFAVGLDWIFYAIAPSAATAAGIGLIVVPAAWLANRAGRRISSAASPVLAAAIASVEKRTSCEFRIAIDPDKHAQAPEESARRVFDELGMSTTRARNAVLVHISVPASLVTIVGDVGVMTALSADELRSISSEATALFTGGDHTRAAEFAVEKMATALSAAFPWTADDVNELPDDVYLVDAV